jgi:hypothetical protein
MAAELRLERVGEALTCSVSFVTVCVCARARKVRFRARARSCGGRGCVC